MNSLKGSLNYAIGGLVPRGELSVRTALPPNHAVEIVERQLPLPRFFPSAPNGTASSGDPPVLGNEQAGFSHGYWQAETVHLRVIGEWCETSRNTFLVNEYRPSTQTRIK